MKISNYCIGDAKLQQVNIAMMVEEDLDSMQKVGGIQEIAEALDTDLEKRIFPGLELDNISSSDTREAVKVFFFFFFPVDL